MNKRTIVLLAITGIFLRLLFSSLTPPFQTPDEYAHFSYIKHIHLEKSLPIAQDAKEGNEFFQPPAYYFLSGLIPVWGNEISQLQILRLASIFLWLIAFYYTYKILLILKIPKTYFLPILMFSSFLPTYIVNSSTVTDDALATPLAIITFFWFCKFLIEKHPLTAKKLILLSFFTALGILTKLNCFSFIPAGVAVIFFLQKGFNRGFFVKTGAYLFLVSILAGWWFIYNIFAFNDWIGPIDISSAAFTKVPFSLIKVFLIARGSFATFWVAYGPNYEIRLSIIIYVLLFLITTLASFGFLIYLKRIIKDKTKTVVQNQYLSIFLLSFLTNLILVLILNISQFQPLGRYLFISLLPISLFFTTGIFTILPGKLKRFIPLAILILFIGLNILGAFSLLKYYAF